MVNTNCTDKTDAVIQFIEFCKIKNESGRDNHERKTVLTSIFIGHRVDVIGWDPHFISLIL